MSYMLLINGAKIEASHFAWDGCHKIYLIEGPVMMAEMLLHGYEQSDILPIDQLPRAWRESCPLRFISWADLEDRPGAVRQNFGDDPEPVIALLDDEGNEPEAKLPCLVCGASLPRVFADVPDTPYGGTVFSTPGHYGSTFFDSFDGEELEITVCDECLAKHKDRLGKRKAFLPVICRLLMVGRKDVNGPLGAYTDDADESRVIVSIDELGTDIEGIQWSSDIEQIKADLLADEADEQDV